MTLIVIEAEEPELLPVTLVGVQYMILPPKSSLTLDLAEQSTERKLKDPGPNATPEQKREFQEKRRKLSGKAMRMVNTWIDHAFQDQAEAVRARLKDPKDRLDIKHIMELMTKVTEEVTGDPTT